MPFAWTEWIGAVGACSYVDEGRRARSTVRSCRRPLCGDAGAGCVVHYRSLRLEIRSPALRHGVRSESIAHAVTYPLHIDEDFEGEESPNVLILGPDPAGNILEVIGAFDNAEVFRSFTRCQRELDIYGCLNEGTNDEESDEVPNHGP